MLRRIHCCPAGTGCIEGRAHQERSGLRDKFRCARSPEDRAPVEAVLSPMRSVSCSCSPGILPQLELWTGTSRQHHGKKQMKLDEMLMMKFSPLLNCHLPHTSDKVACAQTCAQACALACRSERHPAARQSCPACC